MAICSLEQIYVDGEAQLSVLGKEGIPKKLGVELVLVGADLCECVCSSLVWLVAEAVQPVSWLWQRTGRRWWQRVPVRAGSGRGQAAAWPRRRPHQPRRLRFDTRQGKDLSSKGYLNTSAPL